LQDSISFKKSLKVAIGFGATENGWKRGSSKPLTLLQLASTVYWYQASPRADLPPMLPPAERAPAPETFFRPGGTGYSSMDDFKAHGGKLFLCCGFPGGEMIYSEPGYSASWIGESEQWSGWDSDTYYCRQNSKELGIQLALPKEDKGVLHLYIIDPDNYQGGRKETVIVGGKTAGTYDHFETADGKLSVRIVNARDGANAVVSKIEWMQKE
jgi:hypothetical protein